MITATTLPLLSLARTRIVRATGWVRAQIARRRLERLPDFMLKDVGIARSEIDHAVRYGRSIHDVRPQ